MEMIDLTLPIDVETLEQETAQAPWRPHRTLSTRTWALSMDPRALDLRDPRDPRAGTARPPEGTAWSPVRPAKEISASPGEVGAGTPGGQGEGPSAETSGATVYHARVHDFTHWSMAGTYLDLPGHVVETDDGMDAADLPLERLFRLQATVVRLRRASGSGKITAAELAAAAPRDIGGQALVVHALGSRRFDEIEMRSVYLGRDAAQWIAATGIGLLVADVYESDADPQGIFPLLFQAGILTVCYPINLHLLRGSRIALTVLPLRFRQATQLPCRVIAEQESPP